MDLLSSLPQFGNILFTLGAFVVVLSVIVFIHEYGHYIVGRWCGIHAEVFSLGFGPVLYSRHDKRGTKWQLAAIPFGGYVKFLGDADASSRTDSDALAAMDDATRQRSFPGAKLYKKALTVAAGPMANFILSSGIFAAIILISGLATDQPAISGLKSLPDARYSLQNGDQILAINGFETPDYTALYTYAGEASFDGEQIYTVNRNGDTVRATGPFPLLPLIATVQPQSAAMAAGLEVGDLILSVDGQEITAFRELQALVAATGGKEMALEVWRAGALLDFKLAAKVVDTPDGEGGFEKRTLIGISGGLFFEPQTYTPNPFRALQMGVERTGAIITGSLNGLRHIISGNISTCNLQGPVGIAKTSGDAASQGLSSFVWFIAVLSTAIGMLNLFPIPVLDGGHLVFFAYEAVVKRPPSDRALNIMMSAGLFLILSMMFFALTNDFRC